MSNVNYRPNSDKARDSQNKEATPQKHKMERVTNGPVATKKKGMFSKIADRFVPDNISDAKEYIVMEVIVPAAMRGMFDIGQAILDELFGSVRPASGSSRPRVSYGGYYRSDRGSESDRRPSVRYASDRPEYDDLIFPSLPAAEDFIRSMQDALGHYKVLSVNDMFDMAGISNDNFNLDNYGWSSIKGVSVSRCAEGYVLKMPKATPID